MLDYRSSVAEGFDVRQFNSQLCSWVAPGANTLKRQDGRTVTSGDTKSIATGRKQGVDELKEPSPQVAGEGDLRSWTRFLLIHYNRATFVQGSPSLYLCFSCIKFLAILCLGAVFVDSPLLVVQFLAFVFVEIRDFPSFTVLGQPFGVLGAISMKR